MKYLPGTENVVADALSRDVVAITTVAYHPDPCLEDEVRSLQRQDVDIISTIDWCKNKNATCGGSKLLKFAQKWSDRFSLSGDSLLYRGCLEVPQSLWNKVLMVFDDNNGHFDSRRTLSRISAR